MAWRWRPKKEEVKVEVKEVNNVEEVKVEVRNYKEEVMTMVNRLPWATIEKWAIRAILNSVFR